MQGNNNLLVTDHEAVDLPIWKEAWMGYDWVRLKASRVYYGMGIPKGNKSAVILVPGFLGFDLYLTELYLWLWRIGYSPFMSRIGQNAECPNLLTEHLIDTVHRALERTGKKVHLIGHSLGGVLCRGAAAVHPELVQTVITLGSPYRGVRVHPFVLSSAELVRRRIYSRRHLFPSHKPHETDCYTSRCACGFACNWRGETLPDSIRQVSVYTKSDGIVDWKVCINNNRHTDVEVEGTHCGLAWNPDVFRVIAKKLAMGPPRKRRSSRSNGRLRQARALQKTA